MANTTTGWLHIRERMHSSVDRSQSGSPSPPPPLWLLRGRPNRHRPHRSSRPDLPRGAVPAPPPCLPRLRCYRCAAATASPRCPPWRKGAGPCGAARRRRPRPGRARSRRRLGRNCPSSAARRRRHRTGRRADRWGCTCAGGGGAVLVAGPPWATGVWAGGSRDQCDRCKSRERTDWGGSARATL